MRIASKPKKTSLSKLKKAAWDKCSLYIRLRDALDYCRRMKIDISDFEPDELIGQCCTCGVVKKWREMDAGHYIGRGLGGSSGVYFDERNINLQCKPCNGFKGSNPQAYREFMLKKHGQRVIDELNLKNKVVHQYRELELRAFAQFYQLRYEQLLKEI